MDPVGERDIHRRIEATYRDARGVEREAPAQAIALIAAALAHGTPARRRLRTAVARAGHGLQPPLRRRGPAHWELLSNDGAASGEIPGGAIDLPEDLPVGNYALKVTTSSGGRRRTETMTLLRAPPQSYQGRDNSRMWALAVQLYGVRSQRNWGHGDFTDLAHLLELASELGAAGIGLNPLHCLFDDCAETPSPYSPNSRVFLNPLYIDLEAVPEFPGIDAAGLNAEVADLRRRELVDHAGVARLKTKALHLAYQNFRYDKGPRSEAFERFRRERGAVLTRFACFEFLRRAHGKPWWEWPEPQRTPAGAAATMTETADVDVMFFAYVQWLAEQQLQACCERARDLGLPLGLYLDVAVGVRPDGFDAWNEQDAILASLRVGAPPDPFNVAGQNWGLAAFNPFGLEARAFEPFRMMLRASMRYAGAIRIDHVLGLRRVYVIPKGLRADQGAYVRYPIEALLAVIAQESVCHRCIVVGEDLGTVPEGLRETLADWGIWSYQVMMFERARNGAFQPPQSYRANALATFSTHDLPTFAGWASGHDLEAKRALGIDPGETDEERRAAWRYLRNALSACSATDMDFSSVAAFLGDTPSRLVVVAIEDALGIRDQANMPGTIDEHPNWRRRLPVSLHDLRSNPRLEEIAEALRRAGRSTR